MAHPYLAPDTGDDAGFRRSLVLAGGGMRVAYQAGVLAALEEEGLRFHHVDGTSGGTMNLSMILAGQGVEEMCDRWRSLDPRGFAAALPWRDYLRSPHWPALGGAGGLRDKVFPHLGIDARAVRAARGVIGTYNVANFATKRSEVWEHPDVDDDLLVAAVSLPALMPAVMHAGVAYTDAVWIRDSNVPEAQQRGSDEVWLVWCIANTARYANGSFRQYVHMIEMAANGSLFSDLDRLSERPAAGELRLHVIKPSRPLPLDPDYFLGRIDAATLIDLGYQDARRYLREPRALVAPWGPAITRMQDPVPGATVRLHLEGAFLPGQAEPAGHGVLRADVRLEAPVGAWQAEGPVVMAVAGDVSVPGAAAHALIEDGTATVAAPPDPRGHGPGPSGLRGHEHTPAFTLDVGWRDHSQPCRLRAVSGAGGLTATLHQGTDAKVTGTATFPFGHAQVAAALGSIHATNAPSSTAAWRAKTAMARSVWRAARG